VPQGTLVQTAKIFGSTTWTCLRFAENIANGYKISFYYFGVPGRNYPVGAGGIVPRTIFFGLGGSGIERSDGELTSIVRASAGLGEDTVLVILRASLGQPRHIIYMGDVVRFP